MSVDPPRPKGPPLNALRAFEAAARLGGFVKAAEELSVTPGAVSQHIKALEEWTGGALFVRRSQGVALTAFGASIAPALTEAFDALGQAVHMMRAGAEQQVVNIAALPSVAQLWLSPRLPEVRGNLPDLRLSVSAVETPPNLAREMFDLSLFLRPPGAGANEIILEHDVIYPVCTADLAAKLSRPGDLLSLPRLHDTSWAGDWEHWAHAALGHSDGFDSGARYSLYAIALEEARNGAGVLMGHHCLVHPLVARGELVCPFDHKVPTGRALVLEHTRSGAVSDAAKAVISHLLP